MAKLVKRRISKQRQLSLVIKREELFSAGFHLFPLHSPDRVTIDVTPINTSSTGWVCVKDYLIGSSNSPDRIKISFEVSGEKQVSTYLTPSDSTYLFGYPLEDVVYVLDGRWLIDEEKISPEEFITQFLEFLDTLGVPPLGKKYPSDEYAKWTDRVWNSYVPCVKGYRESGEAHMFKRDLNGVSFKFPFGVIVDSMVDALRGNRL